MSVRLVWDEATDDGLSWAVGALEAIGHEGYASRVLDGIRDELGWTPRTDAERRPVRGKEGHAPACLERDGLWACVPTCPVHLAAVEATKA